MEVCNGSVQWKCAIELPMNIIVNVVYYAPVDAFSQDCTVTYISTKPLLIASKRSRHSGSVLQRARGATHLSNRLSSVCNLVLSERVATTRLPTERCE